MSWLFKQSDFTDDDLDVFTFQTRSSVFLSVERPRTVSDSTNKQVLSSAVQQEEWLTKNLVHSLSNSSSRINLLIGDRARSKWGHNPGLLLNFPWTRGIFNRIKDVMSIHSSILLAIDRRTSCLFSSMSFDWASSAGPRNSLVYNCRTAATWPGDMALSVTFFPDSLTTNAVLYGCDMETDVKYEDDVTTLDLVMNRLNKTDMTVLHPMILPVMLADLERDRQIEMVREKLSQLSERVHAAAHAKVDTGQSNTMKSKSNSAYGFVQALKSLFRRSSQPGQKAVAQQDKSLIIHVMVQEPEKPTASLWLEISRMRIGLENWKRQLQNMIEHTEELQGNYSTPRWFSGVVSPDLRAAKAKELDEAGTRILTRLKALVDEYDEYIRECTHIMDGMSLTSQLELSQISRSDAMINRNISKVNLDVARRARRDSSLMKSLAILGMVFLPASLVTAVFSMDLFDWKEGGSSHGQHSYVWIYVVAVLLLTLATVGIFFMCTLVRTDAEMDLEANGNEAELSSGTGSEK